VPPPSGAACFAEVGRPSSLNDRHASARFAVATAVKDAARWSRSGSSTLLRLDVIATAEPNSPRPRRRGMAAAGFDGAQPC
jgi:hypothetical protein